MSEQVSAAGPEVACVTSGRHRTGRRPGPRQLLVRRVWRSLLDGPFRTAVPLPGTRPPRSRRLRPGARSRGPRDPRLPLGRRPFRREVHAAEEAVLVGWSLGGHVVLEAAEQLPGVTGLVLFGAPPVSGPAGLRPADLPNPP